MGTDKCMKVYNLLINRDIYEIIDDQLIYATVYHMSIMYISLWRYINNNYRFSPIFINHILKVDLNTMVLGGYNKKNGRNQVICPNKH